MKLIKTLKHVINEAASIDDVRSSIRNKKIMIIYYDGEDNGGKGYRTIEPVCLGLSKRGNFVLRAWEIEGSSFSAKNKGNILPGWRLFRLDKIFTYRPTMDNFYTMRPNYNPGGDKSMERVFINAKFDNEENIT
jgi:predicted DNA-binding transcriptional regulator YafY